MGITRILGVLGLQFAGPGKEVNLNHNHVGPSRIPIQTLSRIMMVLIILPSRVQSTHCGALTLFFLQYWDWKYGLSYCMRYVNW